MVMASFPAVGRIGEGQCLRYPPEGSSRATGPWPRPEFGSVRPADANVTHRGESDGINIKDGAVAMAAGDFGPHVPDDQGTACCARCQSQPDPPGCAARPRYGAGSLPEGQAMNGMRLLAGSPFRTAGQRPDSTVPSSAPAAKHIPSGENAESLWPFAVQLLEQLAERASQMILALTLGRSAVAARELPRRASWPGAKQWGSGYQELGPGRHLERWNSFSPLRWRTTKIPGSLGSGSNGRSVPSARKARGPAAFLPNDDFVPLAVPKFCPSQPHGGPWHR